MLLIKPTLPLAGDKLQSFVLNLIGLNPRKPGLELVGHFHLQQLHLYIGRGSLLYPAPSLVILHDLFLQDPVGLVVVIVGEAWAEEVVNIFVDVGELVLQDQPLLLLGAGWVGLSKYAWVFGMWGVGMFVWGLGVVLGLDRIG